MQSSGTHSILASVTFVADEVCHVVASAVFVSRLSVNKASKLESAEIIKKSDAEKSG